MNIVLYGVSADIAEKIAGRCDLKVINTVEEIDGMGSVLLVPPKRDLRQLLAFYNAMAVREDKIDAVVVCGFESCAAFSTVQYCTPPGKFFPPGRDSEPGKRKRNSAGLPMSPVRVGSIPDSFLSPFGADVEEYFEIYPRHGASQHGNILFVEEVFDGGLDRKIGPAYGKQLLESHVVHQVVGDVARVGECVARHGEPLAVIAPLV